MLITKILSVVLASMVGFTIFGMVIAIQDNWNTGNKMTYKMEYYFEDLENEYFSIEKYDFNFIYTTEVGDFVEIEEKRFRVIYFNGWLRFDSMIKVPDYTESSKLHTPKYTSVSFYIEGNFEGIQYYTEELELAKQIVDAKILMKASGSYEGKQVSYSVDANVHQEISYNPAIPEYLFEVGETIDFTTIMTVTTTSEGNQTIVGSVDGYSDTVIPLTTITEKYILKVRSECFDGGKINTDIGTYDTYLVNTNIDKEIYYEYQIYEPKSISFPVVSNDFIIVNSKNDGRTENYYSKEDRKLIKSIQYNAQGNKISVLELTSLEKTKEDNLMFYAISIFILLFCGMITAIVYKNRKNFSKEEFEVELEELEEELQISYQQNYPQPIIQQVLNYQPIYLQYQKPIEFSPKIKKLKCPNCKELFEEKIVQRMQLIYCPNCGKKGVAM